MLNAQQISKLVEEKKIISNFSADQLETCSYDLRVGSIFRDGNIINNLGEKVRIESGDIVTCLTLEEVDLPSDIAGLLFPRNEESAKGLLVTNPGHVDPGFRGALTVKAVNLRKTALMVGVGEPIFTLCLFQLTSPSDRPYARNMRSRTERERRLNEDEQGHHLSRITDLISERTLNKLAEEVLNRKAADAIKQTFLGWWKWGLALALAYLALILLATAYGLDVAKYAKSAFAAILSEIKGLI